MSTKIEPVILSLFFHSGANEYLMQSGTALIGL